jgi:FkbM family methyltransferase
MGIDFEYLCKKYGFVPTGIIHIGAHLMEERKNYLSMGVNNIIWIEANPKLYERIKNENTSSTELFFNYAISNKDNEMCELNITNNGQSSSILELDKHKMYHPEVWVTEKVSVESKTIDSLFELESIDASNYNFLNIDIQGAEYLAFLGASNTLDKIDYIYSEVNEGTLYKDCGLISDIDLLLSKHGFKRLETDMSPWEWGDAFYIKENANI